MTNQQIIEKAVRLAIDGGWKQPHNLTFISKDEFLVYLDGLSTPNNMHWLKFKVNELIFNHEFAKALWGEYIAPTWLEHDIPARWPNAPQVLGYSDYSHIPDELWYCLNCGEHFKNSFDYNCLQTVKANRGWQYHLQQMVIAKDPIAYLSEHL